MLTPLIEPLAPVFTAFPGALAALALLLKITFLLVAALAATRIMQRAPAGSRHLVWLVALTALLALPALAAWSPLKLGILPERLVAVTSEASVGSRLPAPAEGRTNLPAEPTAAAWTGSAAAVPAGPAASWDLGRLLLAGWALIAIALIGRLGYGAWSVRRIVRRARRLEEPAWQTPLYEIADRLGLDTAPALLQSDEVRMPFAAGFFSPKVVLPADSEGWSADRRSAVLIHELGHVRRRDLVGHTLSRIACAFYWFHPLVWTAARRLRSESERACDDLALVFGARPSDYAEHLLDIVTCVRDHRTPATALAMAHRKEFEGRMLAILNPELRRRGPGKLETASLVGSVAGLALLLGAAAPVARVSKTAGSPRPNPVVEAPATFHDSADVATRQSVAAPVAPRIDRRAAEPPAQPEHASQPADRTLPATDGSGNPRPLDDRAEALARTLHGDADAKVRRVAAWGLARYAEAPVAEGALIEAATKDSDLAVREMAVWALAGARPGSAVTTALSGIIVNSRSPEVVRTAVWAAGEIGDPASVVALRAALGNGDAEVRSRAAWSIGSCEPDQAPTELVEVLADSNPNVRLSAAWALYQIGDPDAAPAIATAFKRETDPDVQQGLVRALGAMGDGAIEALQTLLTSANPEVRRTAVAALAGGGTGPWPWPRPEPRPFP